MGMILKKEQGNELDDIQIFERSDSPEDLPVPEVDLVGGTSAEEIARGTDAAAEAAKVDEALAEEAGYNRGVMDAIDTDDDADEEADPVAVAAVAAAAADAADAAPTERHGRRRTKKDKKKDASENEVSPIESADGSDGGDGGDGGRSCPFSSKNRRVIAIVAAVVVLVVVALAGYAVGSGAFGPHGIGAATLTEDQLDETVATWSYNGTTNTVTAREAMESQYSVDAYKNDDDTYSAPAADTVLNYVRNQILLQEADARGITATDDEIDEQATSTLGTSDFSEIASQYQVDEDQAKDIIRDQTVILKLEQEVAPSSATMPDAPTEPADGNEETASKDYADYIIGLAGDEWDAESGTWASEDGPIAQALSGQDFSADSATYSQAMTAYYAAYQNYTSAASEAYTTWREFANGLFYQANVQLFGVYM